MPLDMKAVITDISGKVTDSRGRNVTQRTDGYEHFAANDVEIGGGQETIELTAPDRTDRITVHVEGWDGSGHADIEFLVESEGARVTGRGPDDNSSYDTDGSSDVMVATDTASPYIRVRIVDDSGASNVISYNIYAR